MRPRLALAAALLIALASPATAQWPTTLKENLPVSADPNVFERYPTALPYSDGRTLVVFYKEVVLNGYQIIDRYGELEYRQPRPLAPALNSWDNLEPRVVSDGAGGALALWEVDRYGVWERTFAQRLDSLGNRMWGDSALKIFNYGISNTQQSICPDGRGGFYWVGASPAGGPNSDLWGQHISGTGQLLWGINGRPLISMAYSQGSPEIAPDSSGGFYVSWLDNRPPYGQYGATFLQCFNNHGDQLWTPFGILVEPDGFSWQQLLADGQGGVLWLNIGLWSSALRHYNTQGVLQWTIQPAGYMSSQIVPGEPGYFYLGHFNMNNGGVQCKRIDLDGNILWESRLMDPPPYAGGGYGFNFAYCCPDFYGVGVFQRGLIRTIFAGVVDSMGDRRFGLQGVILTTNNQNATQSGINLPGVIPDGDGGLTAVWGTMIGEPVDDVLAKHMNADGSLGGPTPLAISQSPELQPNGSIPEFSLSSTQYSLAAPGVVHIELYDLLGRKIALLDAGRREAGLHLINLPKQLPCGIYFLWLEAENQVQTVKIAIVR